MDFITRFTLELLAKRARERLAREGRNAADLPVWEPDRQGLPSGDEPEWIWRVELPARFAAVTPAP